MEQIKKFLHGKGFALLLTASLLAAAAAGVWAVRALRAELQKSLDGLNAPGTTQQTTPETEPDWDAQEDTTWQQPVTVAQGRMYVNCPRSRVWRWPLVRAKRLAHGSQAPGTGSTKPSTDWRTAGLAASTTRAPQTPASG